MYLCKSTFDIKYVICVSLYIFLILHSNLILLWHVELHTKVCPRFAFDEYAGFVGNACMYRKIHTYVVLDLSRIITPFFEYYEFVEFYIIYLCINVCFTTQMGMDDESICHIYKRILINWIIYCCLNHVQH